MRALAGWLFVVAVGVSCARDDLSLATSKARPHLADFVRFESWARRTLSSHVELRDRAALREVLFAPLALEGDVIGARILAGEEYLLRGGVGPVEGWQSVRLGAQEIEVAARPGEIVLGRSRQLAGRAVRVEMAFVAAEP